MRRLHRPWGHRRVLKAIELTLVAERLPLPRFLHDRERLFEARLALGVRDVQHVVGARRAAATNAEVEAPAAEVIDGRHLLGDAQRVRQRQHGHGGPDADAPRAGGHEAGERHRRRLHRSRRAEVNLAKPDAVESPRLGGVGQLERLLEGRRLARLPSTLLDEDAEVHGAQLPGALRARKSLNPSRGWAEVSQVARAVSSLS
jgi:hypothetical protein